MIRQTLGLIAALSVLAATSSRLHRTIPGSSGKELAVGLGDLLDAAVSQESARATETSAQERLDAAPHLFRYSALQQAVL